MHLATMHETQAEKVHQAHKSLDANLKELATQMQQGKSGRLIRDLFRLGGQ